MNELPFSDYRAPDHSFYEDFYNDSSMALLVHNKKQEVDMTKKPTTPREAADQSAYFVDELEANEANLRDTVDGLEVKRDSAVDSDLIDAESWLKYAENFQDTLLDIKQQDDPEVQRQIWEEVLSVTESRLSYTLPRLRIIEEYAYHQREKLPETIVQARYGIVDGALEPLILHSNLEKVIRAGVGTSINEVFDSKQAYEASLNRPDAWSSSSPMNANILSEESWAEIDEVIARNKELRYYRAGDAVSPELSVFLSASTDDLLEIAQKEVLEAKQELQEQAAAASMSDDDIQARARAIIDEKQAPIVQEAREHAQKNLGLLRKAALAEAALDGVRIKRRSFHTR